MRLLQRRFLALVALVAAIGCGLNPQPEPPSASNSRDTDAGTAGEDNGGGASFGMGGTGNQTSGSGGFVAATGGTSAGGMFGSGGTPFTGGTSGTGGSSPTQSPDAGAIDGGVPPAGDAAPPSEGGTSCSQTSTSSLPGVSIRFPVQPCVFTLAEAQAGVTFTYEVVVEETVTGVLTEPQDAGRCGTSSPGGLYVLERVEGGGRTYCLCDVGLCPSGTPEPITLTPGTYTGTFTWDGVSWMGPSDTGNPKGPAFPAGDYTVTVRAAGGLAAEGGQQAYEVVGTFSITLVP